MLKHLLFALKGREISSSCHLILMQVSSVGSPIDFTWIFEPDGLHVYLEDKCTKFAAMYLAGNNNASYACLPGSKYHSIQWGLLQGMCIG